MVAESTRDLARQEEDDLRRVEIAKRRLYYRGEQYDAENAIAASAAGVVWPARLPEHERKHAYSLRRRASLMTTWTDPSSASMPNPSPSWSAMKSTASSMWVGGRGGINRRRGVGVAGRLAGGRP